MLSDKLEQTCLSLIYNKPKVVRFVLQEYHLNNPSSNNQISYAVLKFISVNLYQYGSNGTLFAIQPSDLLLDLKLGSRNTYLCLDNTMFRSSTCRAF